jgi:hypothetical protein
LRRLPASSPALVSIVNDKATCVITSHRLGTNDR